ncbi:hypothetical protein L4D00_07850 [Photobacterium swingsii]
MKKRLARLALTATLSTASMAAHAASIDVSITNAAKGIYFTPFLIVAHSV